MCGTLCAPKTDRHATILIINFSDKEKRMKTKFKTGLILLSILISHSVPVSEMKAKIQIIALLKKMPLHRLTFCMRTTFDRSIFVPKNAAENIVTIHII
jgi:hypothetical protein